MVGLILLYALSVLFKRWLNRRLMKGTNMDPLPWTWFVPFIGFIFIWLEFFLHVDWDETQLASWWEEKIESMTWWREFFGKDWDNE